MSLKIKFDKSSFTLKGEINTIDQVLQLMCQTHLKNIAPASFKLTYNDCEGDQICVTSNEDFECFIQYCEQSGEKKVLNMSETDDFEQGLNLPDRGKTVDEIVEECIQKQLEASVAKLKNEVTVAVKQMVQKTQKSEKPENKVQQSLSQTHQKKQENVEPEKPAQKSKPIQLVLSDTMKELQLIQDEIALGSEKQKELSQTYWEIYKKMKEDLKINLTLALEEGKMIKKSKKQKQKAENKQKDIDQPESLKPKEEPQQVKPEQLAPPKMTNQQTQLPNSNQSQQFCQNQQNGWLPKQQQNPKPVPQQQTKATIETPNQRAWRLATTLKLDFQKTLQTITANPHDNDDYIVDQILQQY